MKIESSGNSTLAVLQSGAVRANGNGNTDAQAPVGAVQSTGASNPGSTTVSLSTRTAANDSDIDSAKVESIKAALRDGTYTINSGAIADGMLGNARDLLQTRAG
ncbi:flagellar biosynthesis anti-sigma factor FlgM [Paraburkholderia phosphatilytica]|uniref:flagellar biosynthesis anti-sigma factor FlgM n=1 Tax=Paraburkholderia phosphatilytica TaxID=2282883 RepID=UPI000E486978|nr:flagellar biosynthesis anti-sigma factor FlgM [Paraburkholderia phosphatilytica]